VNISGTGKGVPEREAPFFFALGGLSDKQQLFFYFRGTLSLVGKLIGKAHVESLHLKNNAWAYFFKVILKEAVGI